MNRRPENGIIEKIARKLFPYSGLSQEERRRLKTDRKMLEGHVGKAPESAQQTIPFKRMYPDGICLVKDGYYTKMVEFFDINYDLLEDEEKRDILNEYGQFINYFDPSIHFQIFLFNRQINEQILEKQFTIPLQGDSFDEIREEYMEVLRKQASKGNCGVLKSKYVIYGVEADNLREARSRLNNIGKDIVKNLNRIGTNAKVLNGKERLQILYEFFNQGEMKPFYFSFDDLSKSGNSVKDYVAPSGFDFRYPSRFRSGSMFGSVHYVDMIAPKCDDELLKRILDIDDNLTVTIHMQTLDPLKAIKKIKMALSNIQKMKIEEQKKAVRSGYDMDILPTDILKYARASG